MLVVEYLRRAVLGVKIPVSVSPAQAALSKRKLSRPVQHGNLVAMPKPRELSFSQR
jgi:hypothetical protein